MNPLLVAILALGALAAWAGWKVLGRHRPPRLIPTSAAEFGSSYAGEAGGFLYVTLDPHVGVRLIKATVSFGKGLKQGGEFGVPTEQHGVSSFQRFVSPDPERAEFGFTATGFDPGDSLLLEVPRVEHKTDGLPATTSELCDSGQVVLDFSDGTQKTATFSQPGRNSVAAVALVPVG